MSAYSPAVSTAATVSVSRSAAVNMKRHSELARNLVADDRKRARTCTTRSLGFARDDRFARDDMSYLCRAWQRHLGGLRAFHVARPDDGHVVVRQVLRNQKTRLRLARLIEADLAARH